jgi:hypothetical protein
MMDQQQQNQMMENALWTSCQAGDVETVSSLLDAGKDVNSVSIYSGMTLTMWALHYGHLNVAIMLAGRGADLSRVCNSGRNVLHCAAWGGNRECIELVLANTSIDVNSTNNIGATLIWYALIHVNLDAAKLLVEKGANLFKEDDNGRIAMDRSLGPQVLQHAKDLIWVSVKPLLLLSKACSLAADDSHSTTLPSVVKVFVISGIVRDYIAPYVMRKDIIIRDPSIPRPPKQPDDVKMRIEAGLAAAASSSSSSNNKRAREE